MVTVPTRKQVIAALVAVLLSAAVLVVDYITGPYIQFPVLFLFPVMIAGWYIGRVSSVAFALTLPLIRAGFNSYWQGPWTHTQIAVNTMVRIGVLAIFGWLVARTARQTRELQSEVRALEGILPICSFCKKIRTKDGDWQNIEQYVARHSDAEFSHGMCPECAKTNYAKCLDR